jgi:hypothetical protein
MSEPQRDDGDIDARLEQVHCEGMTNQVGRDALFCQWWILVGGATGGEFESLGDADAGERTAGAVDK